MNDQTNDIVSVESQPDQRADGSSSAPDHAKAEASATSPAGEDDPIADGGFLKLDPNFVRAEKVVWWVSEALVDSPIAIVMILAWFFGWFPDWLRIIITLFAACLILLLRLLAMRSPWWVYNTTSYSLSPLGMVIRRGIFWKREEHIPRSRIQHTDVTQGPVQRHFNIGTIVLHTAGTHNASVQLSGLNHQRACGIRDYLIVGGDDDAV